MIKGIYVARAGMYPKMSRMDIISNNLANINTTGFKRDSLFVRKLEELDTARLSGHGPLPGFDVEQFTSFMEGAFSQTNNPLDVAIQGDGFFAVETPGGEMYTRNGNFSIAADGTLVTKKGQIVLGDTGPIAIPDFERIERSSIRIDETGLVSLDDHILGRLRVVSFDNLNGLRKNGELIEAVDTGIVELVPGSNHYLIRQGFLEESNVDAIHEMVHMIELSRNFEAYQRMIQMQDSTLDNTMSVGRL
jgi:flagellar basal-body rod protein FlgF